jgi:hypothetical protein
MRSLKLVLVAALFAVVALTTTAGGNHRGAHSLRWDVVDLRMESMPFQAVPGGTATSKDAATNDTVAVTGSGHFTPSRRIASGGGSFVHKRPDGSVVGQGYYYVTRFVSYRVGGGRLPRGAVVDRITGSRQGSARDGVLRMRVRLVPVVDGKRQAPHNGTLTVYCFFPNNRIGLEEADEGITLNVDNFRFRQTPHGGATVFHRLR